MTTTTKTSRRDFLAGAAAIGAGAMAAPSILRAQGRRGWDRPIVAGLNGREGDPTDISIRRIPEILAEQFDVDVTIEIYPSSQLASDMGQLEGVQNGLFDIASNATGSYPPATQANTSDIKTPARVSIRGVSAESSNAIPHRAQIPATRFASARSGVTSAAVFSGCCNASRNKRAITPASSCWVSQT